MEPKIRPKSSYQKDDCLFCGGVAVHEACYRKKNASSAIRCCDKKKCQQDAKKMAKQHAERFAS